MTQHESPILLSLSFLILRFLPVGVVWVKRDTLLRAPGPLQTLLGLGLV